MDQKCLLRSACTLLCLFALAFVAGAAEPNLVPSAKSGNWSDPATWSQGRLPAAGDRVQIRAGHEITYDVTSPVLIRALFIAGTLRFARDRDTCLEVGLVKIQPGEDTSEDGFNCDANMDMGPPKGPRPALEIGSAADPIPMERHALIRLRYFAGMDKQSCPAIVCCGGRMDLHGAPLQNTWVKLEAAAAAGDTMVKLSGTVGDWHPGDRIVIVGTTRQNKREKTFRATVRDNTQTEERIVRAVEGNTLSFDQPLAFNHLVEGAYRGEVANLSRNVVIESADPAEARGHTMYHAQSAGSISYAEFRHLGKEGVLGRYSLHFHLCRDSMRGSSVIGASIWDSANRWLTIHGTDYLVVRDCVGYQSVGHGFFLEDGTEVFNVLDHNLALQACGGKPLPNQVLPFDHNDGAGFWWANSLNTFTRNVTAECDEYGYRFDATETPGFSLTLNVPQSDGTRRPTDIRTLPFVRFEDNESHTQRRHAFNFGGFGAEPRSPEDRGEKAGVAGVGPDSAHPFVLKNYRAWDVHWALHPRPPSVIVDGLDIAHSHYALWFARYDRHAYRGVHLEDITVNADFQPIGKQPTEAEFPGSLHPVDDLPPQTIITSLKPLPSSGWLVRGTTADNGTVIRVVVNGHEAQPLRPNFAEWEIQLPGTNAVEIRAHAEDAAGNVEKRAHVLQSSAGQWRLVTSLAAAR